MASQILTTVIIILVVATSTAQETVGGNFDYNWDAVDTNTFYDPPPVCNNPPNPAHRTCTDIGPTLKTSSYTRYDTIMIL